MPSVRITCFSFGGWHNLQALIVEDRVRLAPAAASRIDAMSFLSLGLDCTPSPRRYRPTAISCTDHGSQRCPSEKSSAAIVSERTPCVRILRTPSAAKAASGSRRLRVLGVLVILSPFSSIRIANQTTSFGIKKRHEHRSPSCARSLRCVAVFRNDILDPPSLNPPCSACGTAAIILYTSHVLSESEQH